MRASSPCYPYDPLAGFTTIALPPPRRTGSAAAWKRPPGRNAIPVAAPISSVGVNLWPSARRPAAREDDGRAHAAAGPLAGSRRICQARRRIEVGELVVQQEAAPGDHHPTAADLLDRKGVADDVAPSIRHREMRRRNPLSAFALVRRRSRLKRKRVARRDGARRGRRPNQSPALRREPF